MTVSCPTAEKLGLKHSLWSSSGHWSTLASTIETQQKQLSYEPVETFHAKGKINTNPDGQHKNTTTLTLEGKRFHTNH